MADAQGGRAWLRMHSTLVSGGTPATRVLKYVDSFTGTAGAALQGRAMDGGGVNQGAWSGGTTYAVDDLVSYGGSYYVAKVGSTGSQPDINPTNWKPGVAPGMGTWHRMDSEATAYYGAASILDGAGRVYQPAGGASGAADHHSCYRIDGLTLGALYDVEIDIYLSGYRSSGLVTGHVGTIVRAQGDSEAGFNSYFWRVATQELPDPEGGDPSFYHGFIDSAGNGALGGFAYIPTGTTRTWYTTVRGTGADPGYVRVGWYGDPDLSLPGREEISFFDGIFGWARVNYDSGPPGLYWQVGGIGEENTHRVAEIRIYEYTPATAPTGGDEYGYGEVIVRHQTNVGSAFPYALGYLVGAEFSHFGGPYSPIYLDFWFYAMTETGFVFLRGTDDGANDFGILPPAFEVSTPLTVEISDTHILTARWGGRVFLIFDCANPTYADGSDASADVPLVTGGVPALSLFDGDGVGTDIACTMFEVLAVSAPVPCEGPPTNPYPWCPPPEPAPPPVYLWVKQNTLFRPVLAPVPDIQVGDVYVQTNLGLRRATSYGVRANLAVRYPAVDTVDAIPPPPDTPLPPFYDPCNLLPVTPGETVDPVPFTGDRFMGLNNGPVSTLSTDFINGTMIAAGGWSVADIAAAAAKGCTILTAQGGYSKFRSGGRWAGVAVYQAWATATLVPMLASLVNPAHYGFSMMDDFESVSFWGGPNGIPLSDIAFLLGWLQGVLPGVKIGIRALPSQFAVNLGFDFYIAAFKAWGGISPAGFRAREQGLAISRGSEILIGFNLIHGGDGSSGIRIDNGTMLSGHYCMSPAEIIADSADLFTVGTNLVGSMNYQYGEPLFFAQPGVTDALMTQRNDIAALP